MFNSYVKLPEGNPKIFWTFDHTKDALATLGEVPIDQTAQFPRKTH